jgi:hypothetical protein
MSKYKNLRLQINWRYRFFLFLGLFGFTFIIARFLFKTDLDFSLFLSFMLAIVQSLTISAGLDKMALKKYFPLYRHQSFAYLQINPLFYCPGRIVITDDTLVFITDKWNATPNKFEINFQDIKSIQIKNSILSKKVFVVSIKHQKDINFYYLEKLEKCISQLKNYKICVESHF